MKSVMWRGALVAIGGLSLLGCAAQVGMESSGDVDVEGQEDELFARTETLWTDTQWPVRIPVCFESSSLSTERGWARAAVESAWEATGDIDLTGWGICSSNASGLRVRMQDAPGYASGLGTQLDGVVNGVNLNVWGTSASPTFCATGFTRQDCVESTAVHEFGHALGFTHEQNRDDDNNGVADHLQGMGSCGKPTQGDCAPGISCSDGVSFGAWDVDSVMNYCNPVRNGNGMLSDIDEAGLRAFYGRPWVASYGKDVGGWDGDKHPRLMADVDGDGRDDVVGFGNGGVYLSRSTGSAFRAPVMVLDQFAIDAGGWQVAKHPRMLADVNGDGKADIVGFGDQGVYLALSTGTDFDYKGKVLSAFGALQGGWEISKHPRLLADVNGDRKADIVGFADDGVHLATSSGSDFVDRGRVLAAFGRLEGDWDVAKHPRLLADVNGDGKADIVGFGNSGVALATSTGNDFGDARKVFDLFGYNSDAGGWRVEKHPRMLADVNGDGKADIVGFGNSGVALATSSGTGFVLRESLEGFGYDESGGGWRVDKHPRYLADVNADGRADIIGHGNDWTAVSLSTGNQFGTAQIWSMGYALNNGYVIEQHPRFMADVDGDHIQDIVGFTDRGVQVHPLVHHIVRQY